MLLHRQYPSCRCVRSATTNPRHSTASIYRSVHVDGSHHNYTRVQILINLRRLGHQIKPAKSWLLLLERFLIEGLHCPDAETLALGPPQILDAAKQREREWETSSQTTSATSATSLASPPPRASVPPRRPG